VGTGYRYDCAACAAAVSRLAPFPRVIAGVEASSKPGKTVCAG